MSSFLIDCEGIASTITLAERIADEILFVKFTILGSMTSDNPARIDKKQILLWKKNSNIEFIDVRMIPNFSF